MKIKTVSTVLTTNTAGQVVESRPVREVDGPVLNTAGQWIDPVAVEEDPLGIPVRYVTDAVVLNSVGQPVAATPVKGGGGLARRLLDLIKNDTATALIWGYQNTDRRFANSNGGVNPSVDGDPVGLDLDDSKWGGRSFAAVMAAQPELISNGDFLNGLTGWTTPNGASAIVGGRIRVETTVDTASGRVAQSISGLTIGRLYQAEVDGFIGNDKARLVIGTNTSPAGQIVSQEATVDGRIRIVFAATATTMFVLGYATGAVVGRYAEYDNFSLKEVPSRYATQATANSRPKWQGGARPYLLFDGTDDFEIVADLTPGAAGTIACAFRAGGASQYALGGGTATGDRRGRLALGASGNPLFGLGLEQSTLAAAGSLVGLDAIMLATWGGGQRRFYVVNPLGVYQSDGALTGALDGGGNSYRLGTIESANSAWLNGRIYGSLIRNVETSDGDVRNTVLPALQGLYQ